MTKEDLIKYLSATFSEKLAAVIIGGFFIGCLFLDPDFYKETSSFMIAVLFVSLSMFFFTSPWRIKRSAIKMLKVYEDAGLLDEILSDLENGVQLCGYTLCMGEHVIISRYSHMVFTYDEIENLGKVVEVHEGDEDTPDTESHYFSVRLYNGKTHHLCKYKYSDNNRDERRIIFDIIRSKNRTITWNDI